MREPGKALRDGAGDDERRRRVSDDGLRLIKSHEGLKLHAYRCPSGLWTIGYGHTRTARLGMTITEARAAELLRDDLATFEAVVARETAGHGLTQGQFDALVSLAYNIGRTAFARSTLLALIKKGDLEGAADEFRKWVKSGGRRLEGLERRREAERAMFLA